MLPNFTFLTDVLIFRKKIPSDDTIHITSRARATSTHAYVITRYVNSHTSIRDRSPHLRHHGPLPLTNAITGHVHSRTSSRITSTRVHYHGSRTSTRGLRRLVMSIRILHLSVTFFPFFPTSFPLMWRGVTRCDEVWRVRCNVQDMMRGVIIVMQSATNGRGIRNYGARLDRMWCKMRMEEEVSRSVTKRHGASTRNTSTTHGEHFCTLWRI